MEVLDLSRFDLMSLPVYSRPVREVFEALLFTPVLVSLDEADLDVELMEATEDVEEDELLDCLSIRELLEVGFLDGMFGMAN